MSERSCPSINDLAWRLVEGDRQLPLLATADLTYRCNFRCAHCFCRLPEDAPQSRRELSYAQWDRLLGECADEGVLFLVLTGGEALLHPDFRRIWVSAKRRGFVADLYTNGALIDEDTVKFLADWMPCKVSITIYGASEQTYRNVVGRPGMYAQVRRALDLLTEAGVGIEFKSVFTRRNAQDFEALRHWAMDYGKDFRWDAELSGTYREGGGAPEEERLSAEEVLALETADPARMRDWRRVTADWEPGPPLTESAFRCGIGHAGPHFDPYGGMRPCMLMESLSYDVLNGSVREGWRSVLPAAVASVPIGTGECVTCEIADACSCCPAHSLLDGGGTHEPVRSLCEAARLRAQVLGLVRSDCSTTAHAR